LKIGHSFFGGRKGKNIRPWANLEKTYSEQFGEHLGHPKDEVELTIWQCGLSNWAVLLVMNMDVDKLLFNNQLARNFTLCWVVATTK
jgi:hypothetical protein